MGIDSRPDRRSAEVDLAHEERRFPQPLLVLLQHHGVRGELLPERHRHGVLKLGSSHLEDTRELDCLGFEGRAQLGHGAGQTRDAEVQRELHRRRVDVIRALAHVDVLDRMQILVLAALMSEELETAVRDHLVRIHVGRGACAALDHVDDEFLQERAVADFFTGVRDRLRFVIVEETQRVIGKGRGFLDAGKRRNEVGINRDRRARDREVLERAQRMYAVIGSGGNGTLAEQIVLAAIRSGWHGASFGATSRQDATFRDTTRAQHDPGRAGDCWTTHRPSARLARRTT
jgi:hypothetical protein